VEKKTNLDVEVGRGGGLKTQPEGKPSDPERRKRELKMDVQDKKKC